MSNRCFIGSIVGISIKKRQILEGLLVRMSSNETKALILCTKYKKVLFLRITLIVY